MVHSHWAKANIFSLNFAAFVYIKLPEKGRRFRSV